MANFTFLDPIRDCFFKEHQPEKAWLLIEPKLSSLGLGNLEITELSPYSKEEQIALIDLAGLILRELKRFNQAQKLYESINDQYQAGYCGLLQADMFQVQRHWAPLAQKRGNHWAVSLFGMVNQRMNTYPTLLQIRQHLEADIANLIHAGRLDYLESVIAYTELLAQLNMESYKFVGRALLNSGQTLWIERAAQYLYQGQKALPNDPEVYYHLGQLKVIQGNLTDARLMLNQCLLISTTYTPAKDLLKQIAA